MIISYFIYDTPTLLACSLTCYPWYIAAVPHLHHSLTTESNQNTPWPHVKYHWPGPLRKSYELGLLPLVKRLRIRLAPPFPPEFTPEWVNRRTLRYFSALTNLQELGIDHLQIPAFMPTVQQSFGPFSPTLRFLALKEPNGSPRQILYIIGLFPNLQDLKLDYFYLTDEPETAADAELLPLSIPPLRGRLTLARFTGGNLVKGMIAFFGGIHFCSMDLYRVNCVRLLLDACAETLEALKLYPTDPYGEEFRKGREENKLNYQFVVDNQVLCQHFDLSRNRSLRTLETTAESINAADDTASDFLRTLLSTVTSPAPLDVIIVYREWDFGGLRGPCWPVGRRSPCFYHDSQGGEAAQADDLRYKRHFRLFRERHKARDFRLVLCVDVSNCMVEHAIQTLENTLIAREVNGGLYYFLYKPLVISERRTLRTRPTDYTTGCSRSLWPGEHSAL